MTADATYQAKVHIKQGGEALEIASGGSLTADSGSTVDLNGTTNIGGTALSSTGPELNLVDDQVANVTMVAAAGAANVCEITCTLKDAAGVTVAAARPLLFFLSDAATGAGLTATTSSGAVTAKASNGQDMGAITSKKAFVFQPLATGIGIVSITDTAKTTFYPCVQLPNGKVVVGTQLITGNYG